MFTIVPPLAVVVGGCRLERRWATHEQGCVWMPTLNISFPVSDRFGNVQPSVLPQGIFWNIEQVYVK